MKPTQNKEQLIATAEKLAELLGTKEQKLELAKLSKGERCKYIGRVIIQDGLNRKMFQAIGELNISNPIQTDITDVNLVSLSKSSPSHETKC